ncbi:MAG: DNA double-strand break repair nuclease NurA [Bacteroidota bacterium]
MIDFSRLAARLEEFSAYQREERARHVRRLEAACACLERCSPEWEALAARVREASRGPLRGVPLGRPDLRQPPRVRPKTVTVVATDGSQIFPDRHADPACFLLNVGRVALHYGTLDPPLLVAEPDFRFHTDDLADLAPESPDVPDATAEVVSALRDEQELGWLHRTAVEERRSGREIVALADGTLIRWMLRGMKNRNLEERLLARYVGILDRFRDDGIPLASYISKPGAAEVVNTLRLYRGEGDWDRGPESLFGLQDRHLFEAVLEEGERSELFASRSEVLQSYGGHAVVAFYVRLGAEVGRVEMPRWVSEVPGWVDLIHSVILDQAEKGGGYPIILQEAHERAVVRTEEREMFFRLLQGHLRREGLSGTASAKDASKRAPRL